MSKLSRFYGILGFALLMVTQAFLVNVAYATTTPRLEQLVKDTISSGSVTTTGITQTLSCADLSGNIESVTLSMSQTVAVDYQLEFIGLVTQASNIISPPSSDRNGAQHDYTFTFSPPIDIDTNFCASGGSQAMRIKRIGIGSGRIYGSANSTAYGDASSNSSDLSVKDWYFVINPNNVVNQAPVISLLGDNPLVIPEDSIYSDPGATASDVEDGDITTLIIVGGDVVDTSIPNTYTVTYNVSDSAGLSAVMFTRTVVVEAVNHAPVLISVGNQMVSEGEPLTFMLSATDEDNDTLTYTASNLPAGAMFDTNTRVFSWTPTYGQSGNYPDIEFTVTDSGSPMELDMETITITVGDVNRAPVFGQIDTQEVLENNALTFSVFASDPDNDSVVLSVTNLPAGSSFNSTTGEFAWTPTLTQSGDYVVTFIATDNGTLVEQSSVDVVITVGDSPTPVEQAVALVDVVVSYDFPTHIENSYLANLKKVEKFIEEGKVTPATNQLDAFIAKVEEDYGLGILTEVERDNLVGLANQLIAALGG